MIAIVTDSTSYFSRNEALALGIHIVPISFIVKGTLYSESYNDCNGEFEALLVENSQDLSTSQASISAFQDVFTRLVSLNYDVLCIPLSSRLSGTINCATVAARDVDETRIRVVDSLSTGGGLKLLVEAAVKFAKTAKSLDDLVEKVEAIRQNIGVVFSVNDMAPLRKSGRLGNVRQFIGTVLNARPILKCVDGAVLYYDFARGSAEQIKKMVEAVPHNAKEVIVLHFNKSKTYNLLLDLVNQTFLNANVRISLLGPVLGTHLGLDAIGLSWITDK